jgi:TonB-linked SusC/RagA family outer membrane protein
MTRTRSFRSSRWMGGPLALLVGGVMGGVPTNQAAAQAQAAVITGRVTSEAGQPLGAANVFITDLNISVGTNETGVYTLTVPAPRVTGQTLFIRVRAIGYAPSSKQVVITGGRQTVDFALRPDINRLAQVVVTGVSGATEQAKLPINVTRVDIADLPVPATNPLSQLQGRVAGANIVSASGRPGTAPAVLLRGPTSINASGRGQGPLYVVDGIILNGALEDLNPQDIESMEVVKGAAAASLYGSRAANGVITITTKSGRGGPQGLRFNARTEYGISDVERDVRLASRHGMFLDETQTRFCQTGTTIPGQIIPCVRTFDYVTESRRINQQGVDFALPAPGFPIDPGSTLNAQAGRNRFQSNRWPGQTFDAVDQFAQPKPFTVNQLDMTGRFGGTSFFASANYTSNGGSVRFLEGQRRVSGKLNLDHRIRDNLTFSANTYFVRNRADGSNQEDGGTAFFRLTRVPPIVNLLETDSLGRLYIRPNLQGGGTQNENPLYSLQNTQRVDQNDRFVGGTSLRYTPLSWLEVDANFGADVQRQQFSQINDKGFRTTQLNAVTNAGTIFRGSRGANAYNAGINTTARRQFGQDLRTTYNLRYLYEQQDGNLETLDGNTLAAAGVTSSNNNTNAITTASSEQSVRQVAYTAALGLDYKDRYIFDGLVRRDGSSLFGADARYRNYGRAAVAWRVGMEPWWFLPQANEVKLRAAFGTAGGRPNFNAQYETYSIGTGGVLAPGTLGNRNLRPEYTREAELGADMEFFNRIGLNFTYARSTTDDQILQVPVASATGFVNQWQNAGEVSNRTYEVSLNVPIVERRDLSWTVRGTFDRNRTRITRLDVPAFSGGVGAQNGGALFRFEEGERLGAFYGRQFARGCEQLPARFQGSCGGATSAFQVNDDGWLVWVGEGNSWRDGVTRNLWNATLGAGTSDSSITPWGVPLTFGHPIIVRDSTGAGRSLNLGNALPDFRYAVAQDFRFKRFVASALVDASVGRSVWNQGRTWSYLDFLNADQDQVNKSVETAKPLSYYYRGNPPDGSGIGGLYDVLGPNNNNVEKASFAKLREVSLGYRIGQIGGLGNWTATLVGRNLKTWTNYKGFDPEVGYSGGTLGSAAINAVDAFQFPNIRSFTFALQSSF